MNAESTLAVGAAVVALTQMLKWGNYLPHKLGPLAVLALSALGVGVWAYSVGTVERTEIWQYFAGWITVSLSAAGVYGFTRASPDVITELRKPEE